MDELIKILEAYLDNLQNGTPPDSTDSNSSQSYFGKNLLGDRAFAVVLTVFMAGFITQFLFGYAKSKRDERERRKGLSENDFFFRNKTYKLKSFPNLSKEEVSKLPPIKLYGQALWKQRPRSISRSRRFKP